MRLIWTMTATALAITGLAACGQSEQSLRSTSRQALMLGCTHGDASTRAELNQAGISVDRFCTCAVDRYLQSASVDELKQLSRNSSAMPAGLTTAAGQCMGEMMTQATPAVGAPAAGNEAAAEPAAPAEAAHAEGDAPAGNGPAEH